MTNYVHLPLKNAYNVRDLGGYACDGGKTTRWHSFLRTDDLSQLNTEEIQFLLDYGVVADIDLRSFGECDYAPDPFAKIDGVEYIQIPLGIDDIADVRMAIDKEPERLMPLFYTGVVDRAKDKVANILTRIANAPEGCIIFHCAAGKDRTGIVAMLLLGLVGVSYSDIVSNYQVSYSYLKHSPSFIEVMRNHPPDLLRSKEEYIETLLDHINDSYGGIKQYISTLNLGDEVLNKLRARISE